MNLAGQNICNPYGVDKKGGRILSQGGAALALGFDI
jgi:hypothetical protein